MSDTQLKIILKENIVKNIVVSQEKKNSPDFAHGKKISRSIFVHTQFHSPIGFFFAWKSFFSFLFFSGEFFPCVIPSKKKTRGNIFTIGFIGLTWEKTCFWVKEKLKKRNVFHRYRASVAIRHTEGKMFLPKQSRC